jgi:tetratricopeptide (TPR) repeat protein
MLLNAAEESFRRGKAALEHDELTEATGLFAAAIDVERRNGQRQIQARYLSFYGRCLAELGQHVRQGVEACREAIDLEPYDPDHHWNLGLALLRANRRRQAYQTLRAGLALHPEHQGILRELGRMGRRRRPVLPFLPRGNPLNVLLGRLHAPQRGERRRGAPR